MNYRCSENYSKHCLDTAHSLHDCFTEAHPFSWVSMGGEGVKMGEIAEKG